MQTKCFVCLDTASNSQLLSEFVKPDQREFLMHQLRGILSSIDKREKMAVSEIPSANGIWYYKIVNKQLHLILVSKEVDSRSATLLLNQLVAIISKTSSREPESLRKLRKQVTQTVKLFNANKSNAIKALNSNVGQLSNMMRGNVNKLVNNVSGLQDVEKKSERLSQMSLTFESSSRELQKKLARKRLITRIIIVVIIVLALSWIIYMIL